jgi:hypothetical protein
LLLRIVLRISGQFVDPPGVNVIKLGFFVNRTQELKIVFVAFYPFKR